MPSILASGAFLLDVSGDYFLGYVEFRQQGMHVFDDFDRNFFRDVGSVDRALYGKHAQHVMKTDVKETEDGYEVDVDLPGFKKDEIKLELNQGYLET